MFRIVCFALVLTLLALPAASQSRSQLKRDLRKREVAVKTADELLELATWAKDNGLVSDHRRLLRKVLKKEPDHPGAMRALGYVQFEGEWMKKAEADKLRGERLAKQYAEAGLVEAGGAWVEKEHVEDAKQGVFHHDGEIVNLDDKLALLEGKVRHPVTGRLIDGADLAKAESGQFVIQGRWVGESEADDFHSDNSRPWALRTAYTTVFTTVPIAEFDKLKGLIDGVIDGVMPLFGSGEPHPSYRPMIYVAASTGEYSKLGAALGDERSVYGAFPVANQGMRVGDGLKATPVVINWGAKAGWGEYYLRHAAALAYAIAMCEAQTAEVPYWLLCGVGSLAERHQTNAGFFGQQHVAKGGVKNLADWFSGFEISADLPQTMVDYNVFQAGLVLSYGMYGGDDKALEAIQAFSNAFAADGQAVSKAALRFERLMKGREDQLRDYLKKIIQNQD